MERRGCEVRSLLTPGIRDAEIEKFRSPLTIGESKVVV